MRAKSSTSATVEDRVWPVSVSTQKTALWPAAIFDLPIAQHEGELAVAVEDLELLGRAGQGVFQRGAAESHDAGRLVHRQPLLLEKLPASADRES